MRAILLTLLIAMAGSVTAQTYYYERVKIVNNGQQRACSDDAHYITFNGNHCYDSDEKGMALNTNHSFEYNRTENNLAFYYGNCTFGQGCNLYVSQSKDRINLRVGSDTYVYARTTPSASKAKKREIKKNSDNTPVVIPVPVPTTPYTPGPQPDYRRYPGRRQCPGCDGSGRMTEIIEYTVYYTANYEPYCEKCGRHGSPHIHKRPLCRVCMGKGYVE